MNDHNQWFDKQAIIEAINGYFLGLDEKRFENKYFDSLVTHDIVVTRPNGTAMKGIAELVKSYQGSFARFEATQHLLSGYHLAVGGEEATARVNLVAMHVWKGSNQDATKPENYFLAGTVVDVKLRRVEDSWKIYSLENRAVWRSGAGFQAMEQTDK